MNTDQRRAVETELPLLLFDIAFFLSDTHVLTFRSFSSYTFFRCSFLNTNKNTKAGSEPLYCSTQFSPHTRPSPRIYYCTLCVSASYRSHYSCYFNSNLFLN